MNKGVYKTMKSKNSITILVLSIALLAALAAATGIFLQPIHGELTLFYFLFSTIAICLSMTFYF